MRYKLILISHLFIIMVLAVQLSSGKACAETYEVTNTNNSGTGSLRQAITDANNHVGADIIIFSIVTDGLPIVLAGAAGDDINASGDLDILDSGDLTIQGNGTANTIISGGWVDRVFHVCPGGGCDNTVTFSGVTIRNGGVVGGHGGGIYNYGTLNLLNGTTVRANTATYGGGIYNRGTLNVSNSTIGGAGASNSAVDSGGGICNVHATVTLKSSTVTANLAHDGGGIYNYINSEITVDNSTVNSNTANHAGGGIHNEGTLSVQNGSIIGGVGAGNKASGGAGINNGISGTVTVESSTISANNASCSGGGGIRNEGTLNVLNGSTIGGIGAGNMATGTDTCAGAGGGVDNHGMAMVTNSIISANISIESYGGGINNGSSGTIMVDKSTVSANSGIFGGGVHNGGTTIVDESIISSNSAFYGGGIDNGGTTIVDKSIIIGNTAQQSGGGIYNHSYADNTVVTNSCILNNRATINGGGLFNDKDSFWAIKVTGSNIVGNSATSFFNNRDAMQSATGNWWGVATGPNNPGADTAAGNVDTSGYLTKPIPCLKVATFPWPLFLPAIIGKERP